MQLDLSLQFGFLNADNSAIMEIINCETLEYNSSLDKPFEIYPKESSFRVLLTLEINAILKTEKSEL
jgi:hypothetical protein